MTISERIFFIIFAFTTLSANPAPLDIPLIPRIDTGDMNMNGHPDFIAFNDSGLPRSVYHVEFTETEVKILWEYTLPENHPGYFVDGILSDFELDGSQELIIAAYREGDPKIFYIFNSDFLGIYGENPTILQPENLTVSLMNPRSLIPLKPDVNGERMFIVTQGSPNPLVLLCAYINENIFVLDQLGKEFLSASVGLVKVIPGDFNNDDIEDVLLLEKSRPERNLVIHSDGSEAVLKLGHIPSISLIHPRGVDMNFDGRDDLVVISKKGELFCDIWGENTIGLSESNLQHLSLNPENGLVFITGITKAGKIAHYSIDPLTHSLLSSDFELPPFLQSGFKRVHVLESMGSLILTHNDKSPEMWVSPLANALISETPPALGVQRIYYRNPDFLLTWGEEFSHPIHPEPDMTFLAFTGEYLPSGMEIDNTVPALKWTPDPAQLGYHELSYTLEMRKKGDLFQESVKGKKVLSQSESIVSKNYAFLTYVNDPIEINNRKSHITIVNRELFKWEIPVKDNNADTRISARKIYGREDAAFRMLPPDTILVPPDPAEIERDTIAVDTVVVIPEEVIEDTLVVETPEPQPEYVDTVQTEFEGFTEGKIEEEKDPFKKKKLEESVEEFKTSEQEYQEKLKTHKKVLVDGRNVWVPLDSLEVARDTTVVPVPEIELTDTLAVEPEIADTLAMEEVLPDSTILQETMSEDLVTVDTHFVDIEYTKIIQHRAEFLWEPDISPGEYEFELTVSDGFSSDTSLIVITVHPHIDLSLNRSRFNASINSLFSTQLEIIQSPPSDSYQFELINAPENMRIDSTGRIDWVPLSTQVDDYDFAVEVTDGTAFSILDYQIYVNAPPVISSRLSDIHYIHENEKLKFNLESFDLNRNPNLEWKLNSGPTGMQLSYQGVLNWTGTGLGHHPYSIQLNDGIDSVIWKGSIYVNAPPVFTSEPETVIARGDTFFYHISAVDENKMHTSNPEKDNTLEFYLIQGPEDMKIDSNHSIQWATDDSTATEHIIGIAASDGAEETLQQFPLFVNTFPIITSPDSLNIEIGDTLDFVLTAEDPNLGDTLSFHLDSLISDMKLNPFSGRLYWIPKEEDLGLNNFLLEVKDGHGEQGTIIPFKLYAYHAPMLMSNLPTEAFSGLEYSVFLTAKDMYGRKLSRPDAIQIESATFSYYHLSEYAHQFKWTPRDIDKGEHELVILITDDVGFITRHIHKLAVFANPCIQCDTDNFAPTDTTGN